MGGVALRALAAGLVDYAGLFPPASLDMRHAVEQYAAYKRGPAAWMLGRFVVPVSRLAEFEADARMVLPPAEHPAPWRLSALAGPSTGPGLAAELAAIDDFNRRHGSNGQHGRAVVDTVELKATSPAAVEEAARLLGGRFQGAYELAVSAPDFLDTLAVIGSVRGVAKLRTGGVLPEAIPPVEAVTTFVWECAKRRVPFKATAGLHHPVRGQQRLTYDAASPTAVTHGFLNVFVAAAVAWSLPAASDDGRAMVAAILSETSPRAFVVDDAGVSWRDVRVDVASLEACRGEFALAFGSCSFEEPVDDLETLGYLR